MSAATGARAGLEILERENIDLHITDISMPEIDGYEFLRRAHALSRYARLPVSVERLNAIVRDLLPKS